MKFLRNMKGRSLLSFLISTIIFLSPFSSDAQQPSHSRVKIYTGDDGLKKLGQLGIETDHGDIRRDVWLVTDLDTSEIRLVRQAGFNIEILIPDVKKHYREQLQSPGNQRAGMPPPAGCAYGKPVYPLPNNFALGSYAGGYFTYQEILDNLDRMASLFPNLITIKAALPGGKTIEGRQIYVVKISDNPSLDEPEPEVLYTALHHAREPGSMMQLIFYMWYLLENYSTNPEVASIISNTELFFIPCVNPDGYLYNQTKDPKGGGLWRKNRRNNLNGSYGVDINRNYGYNWGYDNIGSSPSGFSETHRGASAFSEPETKLIRDFVNSRKFKLALNYHTYGNLLIYPWGYRAATYTPDSAAFVHYGKLLSKFNEYNVGTSDQTVGYVVNGCADDWLYGEQTAKSKIFAMTPECGNASFGFWPPPAEIIPLSVNTLHQNLTLALLAGKYVTIEEYGPDELASQKGFIHFKIKQLGLDTICPYTITLSALGYNIFQTGNPVIVSGLSPLEELRDSISYELNSYLTNGEEIKFVLSVNNGSYSITDTIVKFFGQPKIIFSSNGNAKNGFIGSNWGVSGSVFYSPSESITDSPSGNYVANEFKSIRTANPVDLTDAVRAKLSFYARWAMEANYDYVQIQASTDNGSTWVSLCGKYTVEGSSNQIEGEPLYDGFQLSWVQEEIGLDAFKGKNVLFRFVFTSDNVRHYDGFYFDDFLVSIIQDGVTNVYEFTGNSSDLTLIPNPASDYTMATFSSGFYSGILEIYDITGRSKQYIPIKENESDVRIETSTLPKGIYLVRIVSKGMQSKPARLVVQ